ncbi:TIGR01440 family protein [Fervidibacillus halotolerans]|uniref:UPF0340 protein OE105_11505 n=1 Tax=Fervidibacillus halotolerans TaxID=2980027 RepID=A0A9E8RYF4_9BACI|nr:TIGR01440 family protein [Fervidibacillus halotolerans]WAA12183.1 TIGR01440 family protein [Fervidibacillus halotolerans]
MELQREIREILKEFGQQIEPKPRQILVVGCSTSEVIGKKIGTGSSLEVAEFLYTELKAFADQYGLQLAFQCCEHLNRALVVERVVQEEKQLEEVTVIPVPEAGGSMATVAYRNMESPVVVESIKADYGIDIGDTLIGMHLKPVVVPVRVTNPTVGKAHVTLAKTRPKLIGGQRAVYSLK